MLELDRIAPCICHDCSSSSSRILRYVQSVLDHPAEQLWDVMVLDNERRAKPLRLILSVLANPFVRPLGEWPNERKRALWQNPDVGFAGRSTHCLRSAFANGGSGLT